MTQKVAQRFFIAHMLWQRRWGSRDFGAAVASVVITHWFKEWEREGERERRTCLLFHLTSCRPCTQLPSCECCDRLLNSLSSIDPLLLVLWFLFLYPFIRRQFQLVINISVWSSSWLPNWRTCGSLWCHLLYSYFCISTDPIGVAEAQTGKKRERERERRSTRDYNWLLCVRGFPDLSTLYDTSHCFASVSYQTSAICMWITFPFLCMAQVVLFACCVWLELDHVSTSWCLWGCIVFDMANSRSDMGGWWATSRELHLAYHRMARQTRQRTTILSMAFYFVVFATHEGIWGYASW